PSVGHVRRIGAGSLLRAERCLNAIILLVEAAAYTEAATIARAPLEMTIVACWVGTDEGRAQRVWNRSVEEQARGLTRVEGHAEITPDVRAMMAERRATTDGPLRPDLKQCAEQALDESAKKMAESAYALMYDWLSAAAHGDLRFAPI